MRQTVPCDGFSISFGAQRQARFTVNRNQEDGSERISAATKSGDGARGCDLASVPAGRLYRRARSSQRFLLEMATGGRIHGAAPWRTNCDDAFLLGCRKLDDFFMKDKRSVKG